jgi:hypothetical protein
MKFGKVAICLTGSTANALENHEKFRKFFSPIDGYCLFFHGWSDKTSVDESEILRTYAPLKWQFSMLGSYFSSRTDTCNALYSVMIANEMKKQYEIQNDFRYDVVIKTDFSSNLYNDNYFPISFIAPRTIYSTNRYTKPYIVNFDHPTVDDTLYWGDSQSMDIATNLYRHYKFSCLDRDIKLQSGINEDPEDTYFERTALLYKRLITHNIAHEKVKLC